jgi:hypothetical protein
MTTLTLTAVLVVIVMMGTVTFSVLVVVVVDVKYFVVAVNKVDMAVCVMLDRKVTIVESVVVLVDSYAVTDDVMKSVSVESLVISKMLVMVAWATNTVVVMVDIRMATTDVSVVVANDVT